MLFSNLDHISLTMSICDLWKCLNLEENMCSVTLVVNCLQQYVLLFTFELYYDSFLGA